MRCNQSSQAKTSTDLKSIACTCCSVPTCPLPCAYWVRLCLYTMCLLVHYHVHTGWGCVYILCAYLSITMCVLGGAVSIYYVPTCPLPCAYWVGLCLYTMLLGRCLLRLSLFITLQTNLGEPPPPPLPYIHPAGCVCVCVYINFCPVPIINPQCACAEGYSSR